MKNLSTAFYLVAVILFLGSCKQEKGSARVLLFSKTADFKHSSIPVGIEAIKKLGAENGFQVDTTEQGTYFSDDSLKHYAAVIFLNTTGDLLDNRQQTAL